MAIETETGAGSATAETLCSVDAADAHHAARGAAAWDALTTDEKEQSLRRATDYMGQTYRLRWAGARVSDVQALDWPRFDVPRRDLGSLLGGGFYASDSVPAEVVKACAELAIRAAAGELAADAGQSVIERTVGPITTKYAPGSTATKRYRAVDAMLAPFLRGSDGSGFRITRA